MGKYKKNKKNHYKGGMSRYVVSSKIHTNNFDKNIKIVDPKGELLKNENKAIIHSKSIDYTIVKKTDAMDVLCEKALRSIL